MALDHPLEVSNVQNNLFLKAFFFLMPLNSLVLMINFLGQVNHFYFYQLSQ